MHTHAYKLQVKNLHYSPKSDFSIELALGSEFMSTNCGKMMMKQQPSSSSSSFMSISKKTLKRDGITLSF